MGGGPEILPRRGETDKLDRFDLRILEALQADGRLPTARLADTLGLSYSYQVAIEKALHADLGIERYWSYVVTKPVKPFAGVPLGQLLPNL